MLSKVSGSISLGLVLLGCSSQGTSVQEQPPPPDAGSLFDASTDAEAPPAALGPILPIAGGWVLEGWHYLDEGSHQFKPEETCLDGAPKHFWAAPFRLSKYEVTSAAYGACVAEGACSAPDVQTTPPWDSPEASALPVIVSFTLARAFCQHYGGDLPSNVEWDRAASGDTLDGFGIASLMASWLQCAFGTCDPVCVDLEGAVPPPDMYPYSCGVTMRPFALGAVGANAWDMAPFGHADLFGNAEEWVRTSTIDPGDADFCALSDYGPDPLTYAAQRPNQSEVRQYGELLGSIVEDSEGRPTYPNFIRNWDQPQTFTGFRCAFPGGE